MDSWFHIFSILQPAMKKPKSRFSYLFGFPFLYFTIDLIIYLDLWYYLDCFMISSLYLIFDSIGLVPWSWWLTYHIVLHISYSDLAFTAWVDYSRWLFVALDWDFDWLFEFLFYESWYCIALVFKSWNFINKLIV